MRFTKEVALVGLLAVAGCGQNLSSPKAMKLAQKGAVISYKGALFPIGNVVAEEIADELGILYINGNEMGSQEQGYKLLDIADENGLYLLFHSAGSIPAFGLVKECENRGIKIHRAYSLDAFTSNKLPDNVGVVVNCFSSDFYLPGKQTTMGGLENIRKDIPNSGHIGLPRNAKGFIKGDISNDRSNRMGYRPSVPRKRRR
tara:strand:- start:2142 stop:2744 length:603 start_codon:yes stop_codon:yes gene_type:complete